MDTKQKLETSLKEAMRSGDELRKRTIRLALAGIKMAEIDGGAQLDDTRQLAILQKEIKTREESIDAARNANRTDLIETGLAEINVLQEFMPLPMSNDEIKKLVMEAIAETNASKPADMGKVMKQVLPKVAGKAPNSVVSELVKAILNE
ncbi:MAG: GatB/YqeY domain-containing protein [Chloroflexi bacterium]|nr:GatB/YqeY domain-containing protein [Chloroflexota bacterium]